MIQLELPRLTGCERVLLVLRNAKGEWVRSSTLYRQTVCMVHSRVPELKKKGHVIEQRCFGKDDYRYRLVEEAKP